MPSAYLPFGTYLAQEGIVATIGKRDNRQVLDTEDRRGYSDRQHYSNAFMREYPRIEKN